MVAGNGVGGWGGASDGAEDETPTCDGGAALASISGSSTLSSMSTMPVERSSAAASSMLSANEIKRMRFKGCSLRVSGKNVDEIRPGAQSINKYRASHAPRAVVIAKRGRASAQWREADSVRKL